MATLTRWDPVQEAVLHLNIPKAEEVKPRRISINVN